MNKIVFLLLMLCCAVFVRAQVPYQRLVNADQEAGNWLTYSGN